MYRFSFQFVFRQVVREVECWSTSGVGCQRYFSSEDSQDLPFYSSWQDCTLPNVLSRLITISYHCHGQHGHMFSHIGTCSTCPYMRPGHTVHTNTPSSLSLPSIRILDTDQTSAFFIGVILCTALIVQKCQALINATKASCVPPCFIYRANS